MIDRMIGYIMSGVSTTNRDTTFYIGLNYLYKAIGGIYNL